MLAYLRSDTLLALAFDTVVGTDAVAPAYLAHAPSSWRLCSHIWYLPLVALALALFKVVVADAGPADLALIPLEVMLGYLRSVTPLALALDTAGLGKERGSRRRAGEKNRGGEGRGGQLAC